MAQQGSHRASLHRSDAGVVCARVAAGAPEGFVAGCRQGLVQRSPSIYTYQP